MSPHGGRIGQRRKFEFAPFLAQTFNFRRNLVHDHAAIYDPSQASRDAVCLLLPAPGQSKPPDPNEGGLTRACRHIDHLRPAPGDNLLKKFALPGLWGVGFELFKIVGKKLDFGHDAPSWRRSVSYSTADFFRSGKPPQPYPANLRLLSSAIMP